MDAYLRRPSFAFLALGGGGLVLGVRLMADLERGAVAGAGWYAALFLAWTTGTYLGLGLCQNGLLALMALLNRASERRVAELEAEAKLVAVTPRPSVPVTVPYTRAGETVPLTLRTEPRTAKWAAWQASMEELMAWVDYKKSITSTALRGRESAFGRVEAWQAAVDQLAAQGWATPRENGDTTRLTVTRGKLRAMILSGRVEWDTTLEAPPVAPCPTVPAAETVLDAG